MRHESLWYVTAQNAKVFIFFVENKITGVLQQLACPDFTFIFLKTLYYFSCVTRNVPLPCQLYQNKIPFYNITNCKTSFSNISNFVVYFSITFALLLLFIIINLLLLLLLLLLLSSSSFLLFCNYSYLDKQSIHISNGDLDKKGTRDTVPNVCKSSCEMNCISIRF
jgi:hypothetical protein